jgi:hypothetical protein
VIKAELEAIPWRIVAASTTVQHGRGRRVPRTIQVAAADGWVDFLGVQQVARLVRVTTRPGRPKTTETVYLLCSLPCWRAAPEQIAAWAQGHWAIENRVHWIRDVTFDEDRRQAHTGNGLQTMAGLFNLAISLLRLQGFDNIAAATLNYSWHPDRLPDLPLTRPRLCRDPGSWPGSGGAG